MSKSTGWKVLDLDLDNIPKLLIRTNFNSSGYQIEITDLSRIWSEKLSKDEIIQRANDTGSSVDPSQDREQFDIFLGKIRSALESEDGTSLDISCGEADRTRISMNLTAALPHPLKSLTWTIHLQPCQQQQVENQLVTPLLKQASHLQHQIEQLVAELQDKDRVISKICDRLETSGNDLTTVFPGVSNIKTSRKKGQREQLARHVKGLADFDGHVWRERHASTFGPGDLTEDDLTAVLKVLPVPSKEGRIANGVDNWWEHLQFGSKKQDNPVKTTPRRAEEKQQREVEAAVKNNSQSLQDDGFQRQGTPPHLKHRESRDQDVDDVELPSPPRVSHPEPQEARTPPTDEDSTTEEEDDDLDAPPRKAPSSPKLARPSLEQRIKTASPAPRKLGAIGGRSPPPPSPPSKASTPDRDIQTAKPRSKFGTIGGRARAPSPVSQELQVDKPYAPSGPKISKLGMIGGKHEKKGNTPFSLADGSSTPEPASEEPAPQARKPMKEPTPPPRQTSQERADGKRDQLKRELEEKAKAPVKKKRKF